MAIGALALDIDGTLNTADPKQVERLRRAAARYGYPLFINTARSPGYCARPNVDTLSIVPHSRHHCLVNPDVPTSKVQNMKTIQLDAKVADSRRVILIDDRPENIAEVCAAGFSAVEVDAKNGIRRATVDRVVRMMRSRRVPPLWCVVLVGLIVAWTLWKMTSALCGALRR